MRQQQYKSDRITVLETPELLEIVITGKIKPWQLNTIGFWLAAWSLSIVFVIIQLFGNMPSGQKLYMYIWMGFWVYFEYRILTTWVWRKWGKEVIKIGKEKAELRFEVPVRPKFSAFEISSITAISDLEAMKGNFVKSHYEPFWVVGGETIGFEYNGKLYAFGRQLPKEDATALINLIAKRIKKPAKTGK